MKNTPHCSGYVVYEIEKGGRCHAVNIICTKDVQKDCPLFTESIRTDRKCVYEKVEAMGR